MEVKGVKFDVYFTYHRDYGFSLESIEDVTGVQDLTPFLYETIIDEIEKQLEELYRSRGWL